MNLLTASIVHFALRSVIVNRLQKSCNFLKTDLSPQFSSTNQQIGPIQPSHFRSFHLNDIPVNRIKSGNQMRYVSAIALKLSQLCQKHAAELADQILGQWMQLFEFDSLDLCNPPNGQFLKQLLVSTAPPGWIYFDLSETGMALWLKNLFEVSRVDIPAVNPESLRLGRELKSGIDRQDPKVFEILYAHHRCRSLLRLAKQERLITWDAASSFGENLAPLPWLVGDRLRCQLAGEWALILQISDTLDHLAKVGFAQIDSPKDLEDSDVDRVLALPLTLKMAQSLSQAFQAFHGACQIWGEGKMQDADRMRLRLGLVQITQHLLQHLLQNLGYDDLPEL